MAQGELQSKLLMHTEFHRQKAVQDGSDSKVEKRKQISAQMSKELQLLFAMMLFTNQSYVDPSDVLNNVVDDSGYKCNVGE